MALLLHSPFFPPFPPFPPRLPAPHFFAFSSDANCVEPCCGCCVHLSSRPPLHLSSRQPTSFSLCFDLNSGLFLFSFFLQWPTTDDAYVALTADDIGLEQQRLIHNVQDLTEVESHVARQLLQEMKWNYEAVAELYYEDTEKLLSKAGVAVSEAATAKKVMRTDSGLKLGDDGGFTCQVCYDTFESGEEMAANVREFVACGHAMCKSCWFQQLKTKILDEGASVRIACPGFSMVDGKVVRCNIILDERFVHKLLKEVQASGDEPDAERTLKRYQKQLNDNYVNNNNLIKWCPVRLLNCLVATGIRIPRTQSMFFADSGRIYTNIDLRLGRAAASCTAPKLPRVIRAPLLSCVQGQPPPVLIWYLMIYTLYI